MISFWVNQAGSANLRRYCETRGRSIASRLRTVAYESLVGVTPMTPGPQVFAALDQLTPAQRTAVAALWDAHEQHAPGARRLNDPRRVLLRFELLRAMHAAGLNSFAVYPSDAAHAVERFPVFVRQIGRHNGPRTGLIDNARDLDRFLRNLRFRGYRMDDLMIVEYCDTSENGTFRKYAAYKIGDAIVPCHVFRSSHWCAKSWRNQPDEAVVHEEAAFVRTNPHEAWLRRVFEVAQIDYGRADYGVRDGMPQLWEINLNPTLGSGASASRHEGLGPQLKGVRDECRATFHRMLQAAIVAIDQPHPEAKFDVALDRTLLERLNAEVRLKQRRQRMLHWLRDLPDIVRVVRPVRAAYSRLFPRS